MAATPAEEPIRHPDASNRLGSLSTSTFRRRPRPPSMLLYRSTENKPRAPSKPSKLQRRESKGTGLRGIFSRNRSENRVGTVNQDTPPVSATSEHPTRDVADRTVPRSWSLKTATTAELDTSPISPKLAAKNSRFNVTAYSHVNSKGQQKNATEERTKHVVANKSILRPAKSSSRPLPRSSPSWDPPPLFQAYPQAIKSATLSASTLSPDTIIRYSQHERKNSLRNGMAQIPRAGSLEKATSVRRTERSRSRHRRQISESISKAEWTQKIYLLVTSGYLLQYSGHGSFDRLPEKMMQLGKDSVAFASDVIPGKHWVLQISQKLGANGIPSADSRSLLSRLTFRGADHRRIASTLFLVLNSAEEMDSWIAAVRREIESLGGKKHVSETGNPHDDYPSLRPHSNHRQLVHTGIGTLTKPSTLRIASPEFGDGIESRVKRKPEGNTCVIDESQPSPCTVSTFDRSQSDSTISHDGQQLEGLRCSANRMSYMSAEQRIFLTSQATSPATSPLGEVGLDETSQRVDSEELRSGLEAARIKGRRRTMQTIPRALGDISTTRTFRHSIVGQPSHPLHNSASTPNFSIPSPSHGRHPTSQGSISRIPTKISNTPTVSSAIRRHKLSMSQTSGLTLPEERSQQPLSENEALRSPLRHHTSTSMNLKQASKEVRRATSTMIEIPHSATESFVFSNEVSLPPRRSSFAPPDPLEISQLDFRFPQHNPSTRVASTSNRRRLKSPPRRPSLSPSQSSINSVLISPRSLDEKGRSIAASAEAERQVHSPRTAVASARSKRRPASMQFQYPSPQSVRLPSGSPLSPRTMHLLASRPSLQHLNAEGNARVLTGSKSMSLLLSGPPPAPPPDCALPPLPSEDPLI